jgi:hypothetical protein
MPQNETSVNEDQIRKIFDRLQNICKKNSPHQGFTQVMQRRFDFGKTIVITQNKLLQFTLKQKQRIGQKN